MYFNNAQFDVYRVKYKRIIAHNVEMGLSGVWIYKIIVNVWMGIMTKIKNGLIVRNAMSLA